MGNKLKDIKKRNPVARDLLTSGLYKQKVQKSKKGQIFRKRKHRNDLQ